MPQGSGTQASYIKNTALEKQCPTFNNLFRSPVAERLAARVFQLNHMP
jgi:hypothetical protein